MESNLEIPQDKKLMDFWKMTDEERKNAWANDEPMTAPVEQQTNKKEN